MPNFRYYKYIAGFAACLVILVTFTACQKKEKEQVEGINVACTDIQYSAKSGKPMDVIHLNTIPSDFGELLSLVVMSDENNLLVPVERDEDGVGASFQLPVHPALLSSGGEVNMTLIDEQDNYCDAATFTIQALSDSPGAFNKLANLLVNLGEAQARVFDINVNQAPQVQVLENNPFAMAHYVVDDFVQGSQNPNSIMRMANNDSSLLGELSKEQWKLIDGMVEQSGILHAMEEYIASMNMMEPLTIDEPVAYEPLKTRGLVTISTVSNAGGIPLTCGTPLHRPSAAMLDKLMNMQIKNEIFGDGTELLDASALLWNAAGVLATAGGAPIAGKVANAIGSAIDMIKLRYEMLEGLLPSEFIDLKVDVSPVKFLEDNEQLDGEWDKALVIAKSRGWSADKAAFGYLLGKLGDRVGKGVTDRYNLKVDEGLKAVGDFARQQRNTHLIDQLYGKETDRTGVFEFPPCEFGPTDITDENWSDVRMLPEAEAPVYLVDRHTYRARATGEAVLEVSPRGDRFGRRAFNPNGTFFSKDTTIHVLPIDVKVSPSDLTIEPGASTHFEATVLNANDKGVIWEVHPTGAHQISVKTEPGGKSVLSIATSRDEADFPVTITAISTSSTGLRALPDAPRREGHALLRSTRKSIEITPPECCVEPEKQQVFQAIVHNLEDQRVTWKASAGSIDNNGLFTAPDQAAIVTITAMSVAEPALQKSAMVRVGDCDCWAEWEISAFNEKQSSNISQIERAGDDGEGRLTKMLFTNLLNGENLQIEFEGNGPLPDEQGTYPVKIINVGNEMSNRSILIKNGTIAGVPSPHHPDGFYVVPPPGIIPEDGELEPMSDELLATVTIDEFTQLGSDHHHVWISGTIQGRVEAVEYREDLSLEANMSTVHFIGSISGSFQGHYTVRHKNPTVNPLAGLGLDLPFVGGGSVYWDVCGLAESEIPFAASEGMDLQDILHSDEYINQMDPSERREFQEFMDKSELDRLSDMESLEGIEGLEDILKMIPK